MNTQQQTLQKRFPVFTGLALFICFALFPMFLIDSALNRILQIQRKNSFEKARKKLDSALNTLEEFSNDSHFAHLLLNHAFTSAAKSSSPQVELQRQMQQLKKQHPGVFFVIAWDEKGQIVQPITDEKAFAYILREVYKLLNDLAENCQHYYPGAPEKIPGIDRRLKMVRHYIGRVVARNWLQRPLHSERLASSILAEAAGAKNQLWYGVNQRITMLVFINSDFFIGKPGLEFAVRRLQAVDPAIKAGYASFPIDPATVFQHDSQINPGDIAIAVSRFENLYPDNILRHKGMLFSYRYISPMIRAFCHLPESVLSDISRQKWELAGKAIKFLAIFCFLAWVASKKYQISHVPARLKLAALFLYAGGIPILIIFIIGSDYLQQKRNELIHAAQSRGLEQLRQIDDGFVDFLRQSAATISQQLDKHIEKDKPTETQKTGLAALREKLIQEFQPGSIMLFDPEGRNQLSSEGNLPFPDPAAIGQLSKDLLEFFNKSDTTNYLLSQIARPVAFDFSHRSQFISSFSLGSHDTYAFFRATGRPEKYRFSGILYVLWNKEELQNIYLEQAMRNHPRVSAYFPDNDRYLTANARPDQQFSALLHKAASLLVVRNSEVVKNGETFIAAAMRGNHLHKSCMGILIPMIEIDAEMRQYAGSFAILSALFIFFCGGGIIMMRHRLLEPLKQFKETIEAIGQRNFRYRTTISGNNEFGKLSRALNQNLENLSELEVARIVQENLLPGREYRQNQLELLASLTQMSHIGGDYYDFFAVNIEVSGVFIGDVSGHGISSALVMAMARSAMIFENFNEPEQAHLMQTMNSVIYQMRNSGAKEYMSGQSLFINSITGEFSLFNAGHCPPILIRKSTGRTELQKCSGLYFGFREKLELKPITGKMEPGDLMVLYTDSWVESLAKSGDTFGFARFEQALLNCCDNNLEIFSHRMYDTITKWETERNDDMTLLLIRFGATHGS